MTSLLEKACILQDVLENALQDIKAVQRELREMPETASLADYLSDALEEIKLAAKDNAALCAEAECTEQAAMNREYERSVLA